MSNYYKIIDSVDIDKIKQELKTKKVTVCVLHLGDEGDYK